MRLKLSLGSAISIGLAEGKLDADLSTLYLMLGEYCIANCKYCAQATASKADKKFLSRVIWNDVDAQEFLTKIKLNKNFKRICIQTLRYPQLVDDLIYLIKEIRKNSDCLISICVNPLSKKDLLKLKNGGLNNVGIGLDCTSKKLFYNLKHGVGKWEKYLAGIKDAVALFGSCTVHLIAGLGESDFEFIKCMYKLRDVGANIALFSFTPLKGIALDSDWPSLERYRAIQLARWLVMNNIAKLENFKFSNNKLVCISLDRDILENAINSGAPFQTSGCKYCTRPFYNERASGPLYNYPRELTENEIERIKVELRSYGILE